MRLVLKDWNLNDAERLMCVEALATAGSIVEAAKLLGITKHALKRRIIKHRIEWSRSASAGEFEAATVAAIELAHFEPINVRIEPVYVNVESVEPFIIAENVESEDEQLIAELDAWAADVRAGAQEVEARLKELKAERTFAWLAILAPRRVWQEETGDALETIAAMEAAGSSAFKIRLKVWSTILWVLLNGVREFIAGLTGRKSPLK